MIYAASRIDEGWKTEATEADNVIPFAVPSKRTNTADEDSEDTAVVKCNEDTTTLQKSYPISVNIEHTKALEAMFADEFYETGVPNTSERFFMDWYRKDSLSAMNGLSKIFYDNFELEGRKINILLGVLHLLSHMKYERAYPLGPVLAGLGTTHSNNEVAEYSLKCFENWENAQTVPKLKAMKFHSKWLQDYADEIIAELSGVSDNASAG